MELSATRRSLSVNPISNILVIVDPTAGEHPAVTKGVLLAQKFNARLELFVCETKASHDARLAAHRDARPTEPFLISLKEILERLARPIRAVGVDVATECTTADPLYAALLERSRKTTADLIIKDTHHHTLAQRTFLTNTDWQLIRGCPVPLLLTKAKPWAQAPKIVAAVDPGHVNDKPAMLDHCILEHAAAFARTLHGELHVAHTYIPLSVAVVTPPVAPATPDELERDRIFKFEQVRELTQGYGVGAERIHLEMGGPAAVLPRLAQSIQADVIAMGAISRSGLKRAFVGSTAEDVLEYLPCDVLVVKSPDFAELLPF